MNEDNVIYYIIALALAPVVILLFYIYHKDRYAPETTSQLLKAFFFGVLSAPLSFLLSEPFAALDLYPNIPVTIGGSISTAFWGAAIPEESMKLIMLWLLLRKNKYFDENMDGIVYAVFVSLGFAAVENLMYLFNNYDMFIKVGIMRGIFSIPGHFCFGILMGYYYSLAKFYPKSSAKNRILILVAPIIVHGIYDSVLMVMDIAPYLSGICSIIFLVLCHKMWKYGKLRIEEHLLRDKISN